MNIQGGPKGLNPEIFFHLETKIKLIFFSKFFVVISLCHIQSLVEKIRLISYFKKYLIEKLVMIMCYFLPTFHPSLILLIMILRFSSGGSQCLTLPLPFTCLCECSALIPCDPTGLQPGSSVYRIFQARTLEWVAISFSKGSS